MSEQYPGGFMTKDSPSVTTSSAPGMWTLSQAAGYQKQGLWPAPYVPDAQFNYVTMLLHGDGTNGAQNNTFLDSSTNNFTITRNGNTTQGSFSPYGDNWSNFFSFNSTAVNYLVSSSVSLSGTFTIEGYVYWDGVGSVPNMFTLGDSFLSTGIEVYLSGGSWIVYSGGATRITGSAGVVGQWTYIAVTRTGSTVTLYINGVSQGTWTSSATFSGTIKVGAEFYSGVYYSSMSGYISNFRVNNTTAINTVPIVPLTAVSGTIFLTCQSNRFIDNSASPLTITVNGTPSVQRFNPFGTSTAYSTSVIGGSGYFDGSGDYLNTASDAAFTLGSSGDFTVECWVYLNGSQSASYAAVMTNMLNFSTQYGNRWAFTINGLNLRWYNSAGDTIMDVPVVPYQWIHLASVRSGSTITIYVNGVAVAGQTANQAYTTEGSLKIGFLTGAAAFKGYITDARVIKGTAVYTADFTPPTAPLTAITNTTFLANTTNGAIFDNAMMNDLETVGNAQISTSVVKYGTGSLAFDGAGDYLSGPTMPTTALGSGAYTVEFWLYKDSTGTSERGIFQTQTASLYGLSIFADGTTIYIDERTNTFNGSDPRISGTISQDAWIHVAVCRQTGTSGTLRAFVNGTQIGSSVTANLRNLTSTGPIIVGNTAAATNPLKGYMDDVRITNGYARYTANFTPPTAAFPNTGPTV
jgi:hypothetical protein